MTNQSMTTDHITFNTDALVEKSNGLRFDIPQLGEHITGFVVRYDGKPHAYINQCAHMPVELDWQEGEFFTPEKTHLICATHGAQYHPKSGECVFGPCQGERLHALPVYEQDGVITIDIGAFLKQMKLNRNDE